MSTYIRLYVDSEAITYASSDLSSVLENQIYDGEVLTFADLPDASTVSGETYLVETTTNRINPFTATRFAGLYRSDGTVWKFTGLDIAAVQSLIDNHANSITNPHNVSKEQIGLDKVNNTSDLEKNLKNWNFLALCWDTAPTLNKSIPNGEVFTYIFDGVARYRFVGEVYNPTEDCFYENFDSNTDTLSNPIVCRGKNAS